VQHRLDGTRLLGHQPVTDPGGGRHQGVDGHPGEPAGGPVGDGEGPDEVAAAPNGGRLGLPGDVDPARLPANGGRPRWRRRTLRSPGGSRGEHPDAVPRTAEGAGPPHQPLTRPDGLAAQEVRMGNRRPVPGDRVQDRSPTAQLGEHHVAGQDPGRVAETGDGRDVGQTPPLPADHFQRCRAEPVVPGDQFVPRPHGRHPAAGQRRVRQDAPPVAGGMPGDCGGLRRVVRGRPEHDELLAGPHRHRLPEGDRQRRHSRPPVRLRVVGGAVGQPLAVTGGATDHDEPLAGPGGGERPPGRERRRGETAPDVGADVVGTAVRRHDRPRASGVASPDQQLESGPRAGRPG